MDSDHTGRRCASFTKARTDSGRPCSQLLYLRIISTVFLSRGLSLAFLIEGRSWNKFRNGYTIHNQPRRLQRARRECPISSPWCLKSIVRWRGDQWWSRATILHLCSKRIRTRRRLGLTIGFDRRPKSIHRTSEEHSSMLPPYSVHNTSNKVNYAARHPAPSYRMRW